MAVANDERAALCALFEVVGPDAATLCEGWRTRDLAAHLVLRERRPDAAPGVLIGALSGYTRKVQDGYAARDWNELVTLVRTGPPRLSPTSIAKINEAVNSAEFLVHHEDVRRAQPDWTPRPADRTLDEAAWTALSRIAKLSFRASPVGVTLRAPGRDDLVAKGGDGVVVLGDPVELLLYAFGRDAVQVTFEGDASALDGVSRGL